MLHEMGYFQLLSESSGDMVNGAPRLFQNPYSWNKYANMLYFDFPPGVRFSYCTKRGTETPMSCNLDDQSQGKLMIENIDKFANSMFSEFSTNDVYLSGESYAGIYVPTAANYFLSLPTPPFNLKGIAVGNGCFMKACNSPRNGISVAMVLHGHGMISLDTFSAYYSKCQPPNNNSPECNDLEGKIRDESGSYDPYYVYDYCPGGDVSPKKAKKQFLPRFPTTLKDVFDHMKENGEFEAAPINNTYSVGGGHFYYCKGTAVHDWINNLRVQLELHVLNKMRLSTFNYTGFQTDTYKYYPTIVKKLRTLVYYGDSDTVCAQPEGDYWTSQLLNFTTAKAWGPWYEESGTVQAGSAKVYKDSMGNPLTFLTIRDAGHLVATFQPKRAQSFFYHFLMNMQFN
jgi:hypothetical protein